MLKFEFRIDPQSGHKSTPRNVLKFRFLGVPGGPERGPGPSWGVLGHLGGPGERLGGVLGRLGGVLGRLGAVLGPSWGRLEPSWGRLEPVLGPSEGFLRASWEVPGDLGRLLEVSGGVL